MFSKLKSLKQSEEKCFFKLQILLSPGPVLVSIYGDTQFILGELQMNSLLAVSFY